MPVIFRQLVLLTVETGEGKIPYLFTDPRPVSRTEGGPAKHQGCNENQPQHPSPVLPMPHSRPPLEA